MLQTWEQMTFVFIACVDTAHPWGHSTSMTLNCCIFSVNFLRNKNTPTSVILEKKFSFTVFGLYASWTQQCMFNISINNISWSCWSVPLFGNHFASKKAVFFVFLVCFLILDLDHVALRPQKWGCLLGTGTGGEGDKRVKAQPQIPPEKDRSDRGPLPEQWKC